MPRFFLRFLLPCAWWLLVMGCAEGAVEAGPPRVVVVEGVAPGAAGSPAQVVLRADGEVIGEASTDTSGAFSLELAGEAAGQPVVLEVRREGMVRALARFVLQASRVVLPPLEATEEAPRMAWDGEALAVDGWEAVAATCVVVLENAEGQTRWEMPAGTDGRALVPLEVLEGGLRVSLATRSVVATDGALVEVERRGPRLAVPPRMRLAQGPVFACLVDGSPRAACDLPLVFERSVEFVSQAPVEPQSLVVRGWDGPAFVVERFLDDGLWEGVGRAGGGEAWVRLTLASRGASSRYRLRLDLPGPAHTFGVALHVGP